MTITQPKQNLPASDPHFLCWFLERQCDQNMQTQTVPRGRFLGKAPQRLQPTLPSGWRACLPLLSASLLSPLSPPQSPRGACAWLLAVPLACASLTRFTGPLSPALRNTEGRRGGRTHVPGAHPLPTPCVCPPPRVEGLHINARAPTTLPRGGAECRGSLLLPASPGWSSASVSAMGHPSWCPQRVER